MKREKALNERKEKLFNSKDVNQWELSQQIKPEESMALLRDKARAFLVMLPKDTAQLQDSKDLFTVLV